MNRRHFLQTSALGFGWLGFSTLAAQETIRSSKRVIFLCMKGAPSHVDTFDYKPALLAADGRPGPRAGSRLMGSRWKFQQHGESGRWISELFPELATVADELCFLHGMQTEIPAHPQAYLQLHTGSSQFIRPSLGAWMNYGLGSLNDNLPGFITMTPASGLGGAQNYGSAFLPAQHQGTRLGTERRAIAGVELANLEPASPRREQRSELDLLRELNQAKLEREQRDPGIEGLIESHELAFRMQNEMPHVLDLDQESDATRRLYGVGEGRTDDFGRKCLLARRMVEAGVRFVEINHGDWDHHANLGEALPNSCGEVDRPLRGLITDLKARGLLDDTLVIWGGEFGRTPHAEGGDGRDHNVNAFTMWMAGGGVRAGYAHGASDELGYEAVSGQVSIADWHATILHLLGIDHRELTYRHAGRDFRLTDIKGEVVHEIVA
ncbi:MAG: DUF1501 domain-containing protein [Planctomycetales bacterium]|nr:DUF1501 domain-containing protein [Planctomycetales bacterium]